MARARWRSDEWSLAVQEAAALLYVERDAVGFESRIAQSDVYDPSAISCVRLGSAILAIRSGLNLVVRDLLRNHRVPHTTEVIDGLLAPLRAQGANPTGIGDVLRGFIEACDTVDRSTEDVSQAFDPPLPVFPDSEDYEDIAEYDAAGERLRSAKRAEKGKRSKLHSKYKLKAEPAPAPKPLTLRQKLRGRHNALKNS